MRLFRHGSGELHYKNGPDPSRFIKGVVLFGIGAVIAAGGYLFIRIFHSSHINSIGSSAPAAASQLEIYQKSITDNYLAAKDYSSYQITQQQLASQYLDSKDYYDALRIMDEVFKNVPQSKITSESYYAMVAAEKGEGNSTDYIKYMKLLIKQLKSEGDTADAAAQQKILNSQN